MTGTTPKYAIPYPTATDRVTDGDNAMQALAERVEAVGIGTNAALNYAGGVADTFEGSRVYKSGGVGMLLLSIKAAAGAAAGAVLIAVPAGYLPARNWRGTMWVQSSSVNTMTGVYLTAVSGNFYCEGALVANGVLIGHMTYPLA